MSAAEKLEPPKQADPMLLTPAEAAVILRVKTKAIYNMKYEGRLVGVVQISPGRFLVRRDLLLDWLRRKAVPSSVD